MAKAAPSKKTPADRKPKAASRPPPSAKPKGAARSAASAPKTARPPRKAAAPSGPGPAAANLPPAAKQAAPPPAPARGWEPVALPPPAAAPMTFHGSAPAFAAVSPSAPPHDLPRAPPPSAGLLRAMQVLVVAYAVLGVGLALAVFLWGSPLAAAPWARALNFVQSGLFVACAITFGIWLAGMHKAAAGSAAHSTGWTVGSWYIPLAQLATPHAPMLDLWKRRTGRPAGGKVWLWLGSWSLWIALGIVSGIVSAITVFKATLEAIDADPESFSAQDVHLPLWLLGLSLANAILACLAAAGLVLTTQDLQEGQLSGMAVPEP